MKRLRIGLLNWAICLSVLTLSLPYKAGGTEPCEKWVARVVSVQGGVHALTAGERRWRPVKLNDTYCPGDKIRVPARSRADLILFNDTTLRLDQGTTVTFSQPETEKTSLIDLLRGAIHFFSRQRRSIKVVTPFVNATVEGTEFYVEVKADKAFLSVFEGDVTATNQAGEMHLAKGQSATAAAGQAPVLQIVARPRDAIQWTLYYPPVIDFRPFDLQTAPSSSWKSWVQRSLDFYREGDLEKALEGLYEIQEEVRDPLFFTYRASLLLSVGRVDEADSDIGKALQLKPINGEALSLQSMIAVVQNKKRMALDLAKKAVESDPQSASPRIALSYALQAHFDLQGALENLKESVRLEPDNALAWARLSELWLSFGNLKEALKAAQRAASLNASLARTQTVLGFAYLDQIKIKESKETFERAIRLDQADPLPRLGLGLALIREGKLKEGRKEIEIAASLDPDNSLLRSYLGKAYYEEKRDRLAASQFAAAKDLDPLDPTPYFYDAVRKETINQPVEALNDMQTSISLNDNRAVYRSRLLLDEDLAARSASLGRIYNDLNFQQLALVEGWRSLNVDPSNFSAHRFLADSYSALSRHEIARVSELLQSQLLQPINIAPLQPHLSQSNLLLLTTAGPSELSYNEFNPLFNRNRLALQVNGLAGEDNTWADEAVLSGVWGRVSGSAGQFHFETDGFRKNNDLKQDLYNAFLQFSLSPRTNLQAEFQYNKTTQGDRTLNFFPSDFLKRREETTTNGIRVGFRHTFVPGSDVIGSFIYQDSDLKTRDLTFDSSGKKDTNSYSGELQYLFRSNRFNFIAGAGYADVGTETHTLDFTFNPIRISPSISQDHIHHTNLYFYSYINLLRNLTFTLGASEDFFRNEDTDQDQNQFNPKVGITWNPFPSTTLRATVFRTFKRTLITNQTVEPTQVAGFNQFFDDGNGTDAWRYGLAFDQKFFKNLFGGAEYSGRQLKVPFIFQLDSETSLLKSNWEERLILAYLFWTPHPWLAFSGEYQYERFERDKPLVAGVANVRTHRFPLGISFNHPCGISAFVKATYIDQRGIFQHQVPLPPMLPFEEGEDEFWVVDASLTYRLPKRFGFLSVGAQNLFDRSFHYQDMDPVNPQLQPKRFIYGKFTLTF